MFKKIAFFLLFIAFSGTGFAQTAKELTRKKEALQREIELAEKNLSKTASGKKLTLTQINTIKAQVRLMRDKISTINSEMKNLDNQINDNTNKVHQLQGRLAELKKEYANMIRFAQRNKNAYDKMMFIFAAADFNQAYKRVKYLQQFGQYRKKQAAYIQGTQKELNTKIAALGKDRKSKDVLLKEQESEKRKLDKKQSEQNTVLSRLNRQERQFSQDIQKKRQQQAAIERQIKLEVERQIALERKKEEERRKEEERQAIAKAKAENKPLPVTAPSKPKTDSELLRATPEAAKLSSDFEKNRGSLPAPVATGYITAQFGSYKVDQAMDINNGVTYQTNEGAGARAVFNGNVRSITAVQGRYAVLIKHGEYFTVYYNLKSVNISVGDNVTTKQVIGVVGNTDGVAELGFQLLKGAAYQNPQSWIAR